MFTTLDRILLDQTVHPYKNEDVRNWIEQNVWFFLCTLLSFTNIWGRMQYDMQYMYKQSIFCVWHDVPL